MQIYAALLSYPAVHLSKLETFFNNEVNTAQIAVYVEHLLYCDLLFILGTCEASWFDSISNRTSDSRFDSYRSSDSKFSNRPRCQSSFVKKRLVVV